MKHASHHNQSHYGRLLIMAVLSFLSMYILMYAMVDRLANVYSNFNQFYMAALMTAPMVVIELILMGTMYGNRELNAAIIAFGILTGIIFYACIRQQTAISDKQFLKSMIPHHAAALLMCKKTPIQDHEIQELCKTIVSSQQSEIDQMKAILERIE